MGKQENRVQELFKKKLQARKTLETVEPVIVNTDKNLIQNKDLNKIFPIPEEIYLNLTNDRELITFLNEKTRKILEINGLGNISIGKELTEVFNKLSKQGSSEGIYEKFLEVLGYKKNTALRYRKRYELFMNLKNDSAKQIVAVLPIRSMELLYNHQELLKYIDNESIKYNDVIEILSENKRILPMIEEKENEFSLNELFSLTNEIQSKYESLKEKDKEKLSKLLLEIKKIIEN